MSSARHELISRLFLAAQSEPPNSRPRFLDRACAADPALREEIESLLRHADTPPPILETGGAALEWSEVEPLPERIGPYRVLRKIGEGGMGIVLLAEQERPVRRRVAVKLIKPGIETRAVLARFASERQALALMSHPNVTQVYDAGTTEAGRSYFVMEYVEGEPITAFCDREQLDLRARLELVVEVCDAVQHAHHKAVIHRDLKPSNILVTTSGGRPLPKIIDFGVAKALEPGRFEHSRATSAGELVGTLEYMSPEQAAGAELQVDTRTDVYSLGVVLYELLTGTVPFASGERTGPDALRQAIRDLDPPRPSTRVRARGDRPALARRLAGDLDWIVMMALAKEVDRRYGSPADLAADIRRHLHHEPVAASPPSRWYTGSRFVRRHRLGVAMGLAIAVLLAGSGVILALQAARLALAHGRLSTEKAAALQVIDLLVEVLSESVPPTTSLDDPDRGRKLAERAERDIARIESALDDPVMEARTLLAVARSHARLALEGGEPRLVERAVDRLRHALGDQHAETLEAKHVLGTIRTNAFELTAAAPLLEEVYAARRRVLDADDPVLLLTEIDLGRLYMRQQRLEESGRLLARGVAGLRRKLGPEDPNVLYGVGYLAGLRLDQGRPDVAGALLRDAFPIMQRVLGSFDPTTLAASYNLACVAALGGQLDIALDRLRYALEGGFIYAGPGPDGEIFVLAEGIRVDRHLASLRGHPEFEAMLAWGGYNDDMWEARWAAAAHDAPAALHHLKRAVARGFRNVEHIPEDRHFRTLRGDPRFQQIVTSAVQ